ncbi:MULTISPECIES: lipocalin family protein [unclassified Methylophaga]|uniref:lipocalin family protein n=1 Tax=unclassified Methylophaga TaxID=2629249 RepID=UPI000C8903FF|nr:MULTISPECIES: lipocalin family protein [unclassified Methylophaga]MAK68116.1 lipocalin [Methylophaga sp.]MAY17863.1 lipocalin [Methylophaga sp.]HAO25793.1 lipocalin [Methylophaga sp.]HCD03965.1 lipocalin [Methylophaga sp.]
MRLFTILLLSLMLTACTGTPKGVEPVPDFELDRYLGKWFEIARLDHSFERGLTSVTADYSLREDGSVRVINRGYNSEKGQWEEAEGKAKFVRDADIAHLKVSFFGPFYGGYVVFGLDKQDYQYAYVSGPNHNYLWLLARTPQVSDELIASFINEAEQRGFDTDKLIFVEQDQALDD